ncbi:CoA transferase [Patulibacter minatonensis]|uniref:CoA transferase n=1 Tax=Patulibacter minatonensis TaxID=298163 RepID=UPI0005649279|nr:CoA transferase [Patulibacter minatonensis]
MSVTESTLARTIRDRVATPLQDDRSIDLHAELDRVLADVGFAAADAGGAVEFTGRDPIAASRLALASAAGLGLVAKSVAVARLWRTRGGDGQDLAIDLRSAPRRLCPFYEGRWERMNGYPAGSDFDLATALHFTSLYRCADGGWVLPQAQYPKLRRRALKLLGVPDDRDAVAGAIGRWNAADLERAGAEAGVVMPLVRSPEAFLAEEQFTGHLADLPLIELERTGDADPVPLPSGPEQPFSGIRALGMGHVIAGGGIGRTLALHGADVLNVWRPLEYESPGAYHSAQFGVRSTTLSTKHDTGRDALERLASRADVFYANRRPAMLEKVGFTAEQLAERHPGIVHASVSVHGRTGPWADRPGFDQTAGAVSGIFDVEGRDGVPAIPLITVVNDWIVPWLATVGIVSALERRAVEGGSWRVHVSLTRVALWILGLGVFDRDYVAETAGVGDEHAYLPPELLHHDGPMGRYQGVTDQVRMSRTPGHHRHGLLPMGSAPPRWLDDPESP